MKTTGIHTIMIAILLYSGLNQALGQWTSSGIDIYNTNAGNVGIGNDSPGTLLYVAKNMGEPMITIRNLGGEGGATYSMVDDLSGADWKFKATTFGGFKIRDHANLLDVIVIEPNSTANAIYINAGGNVGIGTPVPQYRLDVSEDARINGVRIGLGNGNNNTNLAVGRLALNANSTGIENTALGRQALLFNTTGSDNTATGFQALIANNTGSGNTANGCYALIGNTSGSSNIAIGIGTLYHNTIMSNLVAVGDSALYNNGTNATLPEHARYNTAVGSKALSFNTNGYCNAAFGFNALYLNTTGAFNTASGNGALYGNQTGYSNTANGAYALYSNTTGYGNTASGVSALHDNMSGSFNTAMGRDALLSNTKGSYNTACGHGALFSDTTGSCNTATGYEALHSLTLGSNNTACGYLALFVNTLGGGNTAIGGHALAGNTGSGNTALGYYANLATGGSYNTTVGFGANVSEDLTTSTCVGAYASVNTSNKVRLGDASVTVIEGQVDWSWPSDGRFKQNISESVQGLAFIRQLRPVIYNFDTRKFTEFLMKDMPDSVRTERLNARDFSASTAIRHSGFVAQEVVQAAAACGYDFDGVHVPVSDQDNYSISYGQFVVPLVKAVQEQQAMIEVLQQKVALLEAELGK